MATEASNERFVDHRAKLLAAFAEIVATPSADEKNQFEIISKPHVVYVRKHKQNSSGTKWSITISNHHTDGGMHIEGEPDYDFVVLTQALHA